MVGSIKENDGKSTVTANIALNLARRGKKVVLVDCDMRHPSLAKIFDALLGFAHRAQSPGTTPRPNSHSL